jgi:SAM-dependent methyltransferase
LACMEERRHQELVDSHFGQHSHEWRSLYSEATLWGVIHRRRRDLALAWAVDLLPAPARVLEVGCGAGLFAAELARRGHRVVAVDASREMVRLAADEGLAVGVADAHALPFPNGAFDLVVALGVLPFLHTPSLGLGEMARLARPGGWVLLSSDNRYRLTRLLDPRRSPLLDPLKHTLGPVRDRLGPDRLPGCFLSLRQLRRQLADAGLTLARWTALGYGPFTIWGRAALPESAAIRVHQGLEAAARRRRLLRALANQHLVLAVAA